MKPTPSRIRLFGRGRGASFLVSAVAFWILVGLWLVVRDPLGQLFDEGQVVLTQRAQNSAAAELDEQLISTLTQMNVSPRTGLFELEREFAVAINQRAAEAVARRGGAVSTPLATDGWLHEMARARAAARALYYPAGRPTAPELLYPQLYVALARPDRLLRVVEASQPITFVPAAGSVVPSELVGGWMNDLNFANVIQDPAAVEVGVGVTAMRQGASIDVLLVQTFAQLDDALPPIVLQETPYRLSGHRLTTEEVSFYMKGPKDVSFSPLSVQWTGEGFSAHIHWSQGRGTYTLRARRGERFSDPRPVLVK